MSEQEQRFQQAMNRGHSAAWDQDWDRAAAFYSQALDERSEDPKALTSLALAFLNLQEFEKSLKYYLRAAEVAPNDPVPLEKAATLYISMGQSIRASKLSDRAAELYIKERNADKALENWSRAVAINPENLQAHSRLASVYERVGRKPQAIREHLHIASLLQHSGQQEQAFDAINKALQIDETNREAQQALAMLRSGTMLPKPSRPQGGTGPLVDVGKSKKPLLKESKKLEESDLDPIEESQKEALSSLARLFFEQSGDDHVDDASSSRRGLQAIMDGASPVFSKNADRGKIMLYLGQAVELLTSNQLDQAADELKGAINAGLDAPAAYFCLGLIQADTDRQESAIRNLQRAMLHANYALGARLILGDILNKRGKYKKSAERYLEALRFADTQVITPDYRDELQELYEPLLEMLSREKDEDRLKQICKSIAELLLRPNWRQHILNARSQIGDQDNGTGPTPLAEALLESSSSDVVVAMSTVRSLARAGHLGAALEEILFALQRAPTYLPLHIVLGDLLVSKDRLIEASEKFNVVARAYSVRGESRRAVAMLQRVVNMAPMDLRSRNELIQHLVNQGTYDDAIEEYLKLAEVHYSMAELQNARDAYSDALNLAHQSENKSSWQVRILHRIADIETQSLNWRQATNIYNQICSLRPDDGVAYRSQVGLLFNLSEPEQALVVMDDFVNHMQEIGDDERSTQFLEELVSDQPGRAMIHYRLAMQYEHTGNNVGAVKHYDTAGELLLDAGDKAGAGEMIQKILMLNPPEVEKYQKLLDSL